jgi:chromosome segregation protein
LYLRSLTIRGFKSFARKTVLEFQPGVTIIVGPNGSGKSNIADAVMWVLGEQSPTSLRGNRMEDIIFSGSASQKPVNLAEVALTLDNSGNVFPLDYSEVTVSRNVVRGGDSEYRLNNSSCRLLDIQELLSDAGVGRTLNSVISQGQLDDVLSCRPEERRDYIEEAGGLLKYRRRREKAVRRLGRMEEELVRTNDVMREVRRQLRPLQRQAGKLEQYQSLMRELADSQLRLDVSSLRSMQDEWQQHQDVQSERNKRLEALDRQLAEKARAGGELDERQSGWRVAEAGLRENLYRLVSLHEKLKAMLTLWDEKRRRAAAPSPAPDPGKLATLEESNRQVRERIAGLESEFDQRRAEEAELADRVSELTLELNETTRQAAGLEARLEVLRSAEGEHGVTGALLLEGRQEELLSLAAERGKREADASRLEVAVAAARDEMEALTSQLRASEAERSHIQSSLREADREEALLVATLQLLWRLDTGSWSVMNTASTLQQQDPTGGGLGGTLADSLNIEPQYEKAVMGFLGPWAFGLIARDSEAIMLAIEHLKKEGLGQSLFFRYSLEGHGEEASPARAAPEGTVSARDVTSAPRWFDDALDTLLDGVFIAGGLDAAFELARQYPQLLFLSQDGDVISGGTLVKGGSAQVNPVHLEMTRGRREKTEQSLDVCRSRKEALELESKAAEARAGEIDDGLRAAREKMQGALAGAAREAGLLLACDERIELLKREIEQLSAADEGEAAPRVDFDELDARLAGLRKQDSELFEGLHEAERARRKAEDSTTAAAAKLAALDRELEAGAARERELREALEAASAAGVADVAVEASEKAETDSLKALHRRLTEQVSELRNKVRRELDEGAVEAEEADRALHVLRAEVAKLQDRHEELRDEIHTEDLSRAELKIRVEQLVERIVDVHKVPLEFALKQYADVEPSPELERKVQTLSARLEHIGPVNPEAITEREALEQRFEFLKTQLDDIDKSKTQLRKIVKQVDTEIEEKFRDTLDAVNSNFKDIFSTLFPNGNAELGLTDPDDLLNTGVEILAQPEGKRLRRISLLSGGETSLTALAFFFALFKVRPSPFYFLDEVEAALDDVNLHRFLDLVKQFKDESQLILITHQKRSMEIADILYGVTMQEDGISRVVSQKVAS